MENPLSSLLCPAPTHGSEPGEILQIPWETDAGKFKSVSQLLAAFAAETHQNCSAFACLCRCLQKEKGGRRVGFAAGSLLSWPRGTQRHKERSMLSC